MIILAQNTTEVAEVPPSNPAESDSDTIVIGVLVVLGFAVLLGMVFGIRALHKSGAMRSLHDKDAFEKVDPLALDKEKSEEAKLEKADPVTSVEKLEKAKAEEVKLEKPEKSDKPKKSKKSEAK